MFEQQKHLPDIPQKPSIVKHANKYRPAETNSLTKYKIGLLKIKQTMETDWRM